MTFNDLRDATRKTLADFDAGRITLDERTARLATLADCGDRDTAIQIIGDEMMNRFEANR